MNSKLDEKIAELLNNQFQKELESAYLYLYFASKLDSTGLCGFSHWFKMQSREEEEHAMKFYNYLIERGEKVKFCQLECDCLKIEGLLQILLESLKHEEYVTALINKIYSAAKDVNDFATLSFLNWFITEQREEELQVQELIDKYNLFGKESSGLYMLDKELAKR